MLVFLCCLIFWKNRSDANSNYSVRAHKSLFRFLSDDFLKGVLFQLSYVLCMSVHIGKIVSRPKIETNLWQKRDEIEKKKVNASFLQIFSFIGPLVPQK